MPWPAATSACAFAQGARRVQPAHDLLQPHGGGVGTGGPAPAQLTADVAHELRTPLQVIQGNLEGFSTMSTRPRPSNIAATLDETRNWRGWWRIRACSRRRRRGQLPMTWEPVNVAELVADAQTSFAGQAEAREIALR